MNKTRRTFSQSYYEHPVLISAFISGLFCYSVISPLAMVVEHLTHTGMGTLVEHLQDLFLLRNPSWSATFTIIGVGFGVMYGYLQNRVYKLEESLFQVKKLASIGQLAAGVAHEINTPLTNISIITDNLKMKMKDKDGTLADDIEEISAQVENASNIVTDLLNFSSPSEMEFVEVNINELISHTLSFIKNKRKEDIELIEKFRNDIPMVRGEPNQLQQVFINIINNAYDAMPEKGLLEIATDIKNDDYIEIKFKDNGTGISRENLSKIFDPFFTTKTQGGGTGLGLSICHGMIRNHNGTIKVDSKVNVGTTFTVILPR